jgi:hypothetical protein
LQVAGFLDIDGSAAFHRAALQGAERILATMHIPFGVPHECRRDSVRAQT